LVGLTAEVCMYSGPSGSYSLRRKVAFLGVPGIMVAAVLSIALHGGAYGGGPLTELLLVATPINFAFYAGLGIVGRILWKTLRRKA